MLMIQNIAHPPAPVRSNDADGMLLALGGFTLFTLFDTLLKLVSAGGYPPWQVMGVSGLAAFATILATARLSGGVRLRLATRAWRFHLLRGVLTVSAFGCGYLAISRIPLVDYYAIVFTGPILATVLAVVWLRDHVGPWRWGAVACGFGGVLFVLRPWADVAPAQNDGYSLALATMVLGVAAMMMVRRYGRSEQGLTFSFYAVLSNLCITGLITLFYGAEPMRAADVMVMLAAGCFSGMGGMCLTIAAQRTPPAKIAPLQYVQMIWGALAGYLIWGHMPDATMLAGAAVVIASGLVIFWREAHHARRRQQLPTIHPQS